MIITAEGNLLRVAVLVNVGTTLVDKLVLLDLQRTNMYSDDEQLIKRVQRISSALSATSKGLDAHFAGLSENASPEDKKKNSLQMRFPQPTLELSETNTPIRDGLQSALENVGPFSRLEFKNYLQRDDLGSTGWVKADMKPSAKMELLCGLYVADAFRKEDDESEEVVVKFVQERPVPSGQKQTYGYEAHKLLEKEGSATPLHGVVPWSSWSE